MQPTIDMAVEVKSRSTGERSDAFEVDLCVNVTAKRADAMMFSVNLIYSGLFQFMNVRPEDVEPLIWIECPRLLFPFGRQILAEITREGGFPPFETQNFAPQLIWLALIFGLLYILMSRIALPRVGAILETREAKISADLDASRELQAKAQAAAGDNEQTLRVKREEAQTIGREASQKIADDIAARRAAAEKSAADKLRAAEAEILAEKAKLMAEVEHIAIDAAASIIEKLTGARVDKAALAAEFAGVKAR